MAMPHRLVTVCEREFQMTLGPAEDALDSVGALYARILGGAPKSGGEGCACVSNFVRLRRVLARDTGVALRSIQPSTPLKTLVPQWDRGRRWHALGLETSMALPLLKTSMLEGVAAVIAIALGIPAAFAITVFISALIPGELHGDAIIITFSVAGTFMVFGIPSILFLGMKRYAPLYFPRNCQSLGEAANTALPGYGDVASAHLDSVWVWRELRQIAARELGIPESEVDPAMKLSED